MHNELHRLCQAGLIFIKVKRNLSLTFDLSLILILITQTQKPQFKFWSWSRYRNFSLSFDLIKKIQKLQFKFRSWSTSTEISVYVLILIKKYRNFSLSFGLNQRVQKSQCISINLKIKTCKLFLIQSTKCPTKSRGQYRNLSLKLWFWSLLQAAWQSLIIPRPQSPRKSAHKLEVPLI